MGSGKLNIKTTLGGFACVRVWMAMGILAVLLAAAFPFVFVSSSQAQSTPTLDAATVDGLSLVLTYDEDLDENSVPDQSAYSVTVGSNSAAQPSGVDISGKTVTLTLATAASAGDTVTLTYTVPGSNPVQDLAGNDAGALTDQSVTNNTPDTTLSALVIEDANGNAVMLDPAFASSTTSYTASVDHVVDVITVSPTAADSGATVGYFDVNDLAIADADGVAVGHQAALDVGQNTVKVKVTAADTVANQTYTVVITRAAQVLVSNFGQSSDANLRASILAQEFTVESSSDYTLTSVTIDVGFRSSSGVDVAIRTVSGSDPAAADLYSLTEPGGPGMGSRTYMAPANATLTKGTSYFVAITGTSNAGSPVAGTHSDGEDSSGVSGWTIADDRRFFSAGRWSGGAEAIKMEIKGYVGADAPRINSPAAGRPTILGVPLVGEELTAELGDVADDDGIPGYAAAFVYQWIRVDSDGASNPTDIGADSSKYTLTDADEDKRVKVKVSFTDIGGFDEEVESLAFPSHGAVGPAGQQSR